MSTATINAPSYLRAETRRWFVNIAEEFQLEPHHLKILEAAAFAWDEFVTAREAITEHGQTYVDRYNQPRERPESEIARKARTQFSRLVRELALDHVQPPDFRAPRIGGQQH